MAVSKGRLSLIGEKNIEGAPELRVDILSEGTKKRDRREKFSFYELSGVSESWIVDPESPIVQVFRLSLRHKRLPSSRIQQERLSVDSPPSPASRFPSPRFFSVLGDSFVQKVRTLFASGRVEPAMAGPLNPDRSSHPQDAPMPGAPIRPRPEGRGLPRDWINAGQIDETTGTDPEKKTFMPVPLCSPDPGGQSLFLQVVFLLGRQAGKRKSRRSLKVLWTFRTGRSEADVVFRKESFSSVTP